MKKLSCQFFGVFPAVKEYLRARLGEHHLSISEHELQSLEELNKKTDVLGVFVGTRVDANVIDRLPNLKLIVTMSTGYDHIDMAYAEQKHIPVANVPTYGENTVAEHTLALILALSRKLYPSIKRVKEGQFDYDGLEGFDLRGKTIGVVGTGHIGAHVIRMLKGFETSVIAYDAFPNKELETALGFTYAPLKTVLAEADMITLHIPLFKETHHIIDKRSIALMKTGVYIVNTARGGLIDPEALLWGLTSGKIAGAGLDVLEIEDTLQHPDHLVLSTHTDRDIKLNLMERELITHPSVIVTPHNAFNSREALERIMSVTTDTITSFATGEQKNIVKIAKN